MPADPAIPSPPSPTISPSTSLAAAATLNSALRHSESGDEHLQIDSSSPSYNLNSSQAQSTNGLEQRRSSIRMRLATMDPTLPAPGELAMSPVARQRAPSLSSSQISHSRQQSLSELHQEAEYEQEAQFNRLRTVIRAHQAHLDALNAENNPSGSNNNGSAIEDTPNASSPPSGDSTPAMTDHFATTSLPLRHTSHSQQQHPRVTQFRSRESSIVAASSPNIPFVSTTASPAPDDSPSLVGMGLGLSQTTSSSSSMRDEAAFVQAETSMFVRENQMLRRRIRELEGQLSELEGVDVHMSHLRES